MAAKVQKVNGAWWLVIHHNTNKRRKRIGTTNADKRLAERVAGQINAQSREAFRQIIDRMITEGAEAVILGCTEIMLLVRQEDSAVPLFDTTALHAQAAIEAALAD